MQATRPTASISKAKGRILSGDFQIRHFDDVATKAFLEGAIRPTTSVPFFGAGFSGGERARNKLVPFGAEWLSIMRAQILASASSDKPSEVELDGMNFQDVSDIYFSDELVPLDEIKRALDDHFSKVVIQNASKKRLLDIEWPYVYTLNIDDGIESAIDAVKILPYKKFSKLKNKRFVYKLHGDVEDLLAAPSHKDMAAIFGRKQYIAGLDKNQAMLADLTNDFAEKNLIFIGCSLSDELDILLALARAESASIAGKGARIFVCSKAPTSYTEKKKMRDYGISDVIVVPDYSSFYGFLTDAIDRNEKTITPLAAYEYIESPESKWTKTLQIRYLIQAGWRGDSYNFSIRRGLENRIQLSLKQNALIAVWGRRFSGRTSLLYRILNEHKTRRRFLITSSTTVSDSLFNAIFRVKNSLIAIDTNALFVDQIRRLSEQSHRIYENGSTVIVTMSRGDLNSLGRDFDYENGVFEIEQRFDKSERIAIDKVTSPLGYKKWSAREPILDNMFEIASSAITTATVKDGSILEAKLRTLCDQWKDSETSRLQFMVMYYLTVRHHMPSKSIRTLAKARGQGYMGDVLLDEIPATWQPFVEREASDPSSRVAANSNTQLVSNSFAWLRRVVRTISEKVGSDESANLIADLFSAIKDVDNNSYELVLFDSLNAVYEPTHGGADWRRLAIRRVYERLSFSLAEEPDYWLQRAKAIYYISTDVDELRVAAAFCEKGILERASQKTWSNAQLTRANIYGKLCALTKYAHDADMLIAVQAYHTVIGHSHLNSVYIDELLRKSKNGKHHLSQLCAAASIRPGMLIARDTLRVLEDYIGRS